MPLPPLADNLTYRAWLKYKVGTQEHEMCWRQDPANTTSDIIANANAIATALKVMLPTTGGFSALRYSPAGSTLSFPLAFTAQAGTGAAVAENQDESKFIALAGRSADGYRCRITFFSAGIADNIGYRVLPGVDAGCTLFYNTITGLSPTLRSKSGGLMLWNAYINIGYNSYWQRQLR